VWQPVYVNTSSRDGIARRTTNDRILAILYQYRQNRFSSLWHCDTSESCYSVRNNGYNSWQLQHSYRFYRACYLLSSCIRLFVSLSVRPSVRHKPVLYRNDYTNRAGFGHDGLRCDTVSGYQYCSENSTLMLIHNVTMTWFCSISSMPVYFCRHLVGKTLRNVCHCDDA